MGGSYQVTNTVTIPANAPPSYYLILKTDDQNAVLEANETKNMQQWRAKAERWTRKRNRLDTERGPGIVTAVRNAHSDRH